MTLKESLLLIATGSARRDEAILELHHALKGKAERTVRNRHASIFIPESHRHDMTMEILVKLIALPPERLVAIASEDQVPAYLSAMLANKYFDYLRETGKEEPPDSGSGGGGPGPGIETVLDRLLPWVLRLLASCPKEHRSHMEQAWEEAKQLLDRMTTDEILPGREGETTKQKRERLAPFYKRQERFRTRLMESAKEENAARRMSDIDLETMLEDIGELRQRRVSKRGAERPPQQGPGGAGPRRHPGRRE